jgi:hypothetical protein
LRPASALTSVSQRRHVEIGGIEPETIAEAYRFPWKDGDDSVLPRSGRRRLSSSDFAEDRDIAVGDQKIQTADKTADVTVVGTFEPLCTAVESERL